jgi:hypothetical protein
MCALSVLCSSGYNMQVCAEMRHLIIDITSERNDDIIEDTKQFFCSGSKLRRTIGTCHD